jgi:hypothetical protein
VKEFGVSVNGASVEYGIPRSTLRRHLECDNTLKPGGKTIFSKHHENMLKERLFYMTSRGFPCTTKDVRKYAFLFAKKLVKRKQIAEVPPAWEQNKAASLDWFYRFRKAHSDISLRIAENISAQRAEAFNEERVNNFFATAQTVYDSLEIHDYPQLVYNADETGLSSVPSKSNKVIARYGSKIVSRIQAAERGTLTTILPCGNASGQLLPPFIIFKGPIIPPLVNFPENTRVVTSKSGWIDQDLFLMFLQHFHQFRVKIPNKKCILIMDGHRSHVSVSAISYCQEHDIELLCLPPHSSHRLQPLDTHFNGPLKRKWAQAVHEFLDQSSQVSLTKFTFGQVFTPTWISMTENRGLLVNGFSHCGLYPLRNPTTVNDFNLSKTFADVNQEFSFCNPSEKGSVLKIVIPSPQKNPNPCHKRPHVAHISSSDYPIKKKAMTQTAALQPIARGNQEPFLRSPKIKSAGSEKQKTPLDNRDKRKKKPMTAQAARKSSKPRDPHQAGPSRAHYDNDICCVCGCDYGSSLVDWYECVTCQRWCCEDCFASTTCKNCLDE